MAGLTEIEAMQLADQAVDQAPSSTTRARQAGAGRKTIATRDETLLTDLLALVESTSRGDPESPLRWTCKSLRNLADELKANGHGGGSNGHRVRLWEPAEWLEVPAGVVAQVMGHKPSATAEKHYTVRPLDLLRVHHEKIEAWILEQAGIAFDAKAAPSALRVVVG